MTRPGHLIRKVAIVLFAGSLVAAGCDRSGGQSSVTSPVSKQDAASQDGGETGTFFGGLLCLPNEHFDVSACACVPASNLDAAAVDSALLCGGVACLAGEHLDTHSCKCVSSLPQDAGPTELAPPVECGGMVCPFGDRLDLRLCMCVASFDATFCGGILCRPDDHFDKGLCECVPNASSSDASSSDASSFF